MSRSASTLFAVLLVAAGAAPVAGAAEPGDSAFRPTPERPLGWRGTGGSHFPGASPPTAFGPEENSRWAADLGDWSWSTPVAFGEVAIAQVEPHDLVCLSLADGSERWRVSVDQFALMDEAKAAEGRALLAEEEERRAEARAWGEKVKALKGELHEAGHKDWTGGKNFSRAFGDRAEEDPPVPTGTDFAERWKTLAAEGRAEGFSFDRHRGGHLAWTDAVKARRKRLAGEFGIFWETTERGWHRVSGESMPTPVCDGTRIYCSFANNVVACFDLDGSAVWEKWDNRLHPGRDVDEQVRRELYYIASPVLAGDLVIVANGKDRLRAYRRDDGEKAWEVDYPMPKNAVGTPAVLALEHVTVLVAANGRIYRAEDGEVLKDDLPECKGGNSPLAAGGLVYLRTENKGDDRGLYALRIASTSADEVAVEEVWRAPDAGRSDRAPVVAGGLLFTTAKEGKKDHVVVALDAATGEERGRTDVEPRGNPTFSVAGDKLIVKGNGREFWIFAADAGLAKVGEPALAKGSRGFAYPTFVGDAMLVRQGNELVCVGE